MDSATPTPSSSFAKSMAAGMGLDTSPLRGLERMSGDLKAEREKGGQGKKSIMG